MHNMHLVTRLVEGKTPGHNIFEFDKVLAQFQLARSKMELDI